MGFPLFISPEFRPARNPQSSPVQKNPEWQIDSQLWLSWLCPRCLRVTWLSRRDHFPGMAIATETATSKSTTGVLVRATALSGEPA